MPHQRRAEPADRPECGAEPKGLCELIEPGQGRVPIGEVPQRAAGSRGGRPLDERLELHIAAEDAAAPVPRRHAAERLRASDFSALITFAT